MADMKILAIGKIQKMYEPAQEEFLKRLTRYTKCRLTELEDEQAPERLSDNEKLAVQNAEWEKIRKKLAPSDFLILLDSTGKKMNSVAFSQKLEAWQEKKDVTFALGGSLGFPPAAFERADFVLSFSDMTFTHSMARVILLEQIYRGFKIMKGEPYHK